MCLAHPNQLNETSVQNLMLNTQLVFTCQNWGFCLDEAVICSVWHTNALVMYAFTIIKLRKYMFERWTFFFCGVQTDAKISGFNRVLGKVASEIPEGEWNQERDPSLKRRNTLATKLRRTTAYSSLLMSS